MLDKLERLYSGMFSDELDRMGYRDQVVSGLRLNRSELKCLGPIRTVKIETKETPDENIWTGLSFLESLDAGEILCVQGSTDFAYFGELMTRLSIRQGLAGAVIDGLTRDSCFTRQLGAFPIFARDYSPKDIKGRGCVEAVDVPIKLGAVEVAPSDWMFGDSDGIIVIPGSAKDELFQRVAAVIEDEQAIVERIDRGESISSILNFHSAF